MAEVESASKLYWTGGPFRVLIRCWPERQQDECDKAVTILDECRSAFQKQFMLFDPIVSGRPLAHDRWSKLFKPEHRNNKITIGNALPGTEQSPGRSVIAETTQGELLDGLSVGGAFDSQHAKAVIVFTYHLWDEFYRVKIAETLRVSTKQVTCDLMGDIRLIRNVIIHNRSIIEKKTLQALNFLPGLWQVEQGELVITSAMLYSLMEQLNAIRVDVVE